MRGHSPLTGGGDGWRARPRRPLRSIGMTAGATKSFTITYPADYAIPELAGGTVDYTVTLKEIKKRVVPALDDELAKDRSLTIASSPPNAPNITAAADSTSRGPVLARSRVET